MWRWRPVYDVWVSTPKSACLQLLMSSTTWQRRHTSGGPRLWLHDGIRNNLMNPLETRKGTHVFLSDFFFVRRLFLVVLGLVCFVLLTCFNLALGLASLHD